MFIFMLIFLGFRSHVKVFIFEHKAIRANYTQKATKKKKPPFFMANLQYKET
jgi:hypothetical protein